MLKFVACEIWAKIFFFNTFVIYTQKVKKLNFKAIFQHLESQTFLVAIFKDRKLAKVSKKLFLI